MRPPQGQRMEFDRDGDIHCNGQPCSQPVSTLPVSTLIAFLTLQGCHGEAQGLPELNTDAGADAHTARGEHGTVSSSVSLRHCIGTSGDAPPRRITGIAPGRKAVSFSDIGQVTYG